MGEKPRFDNNVVQGGSKTGPPYQKEEEESHGWIIKSPVQENSKIVFPWKNHTLGS